MVQYIYFKRGSNLKPYILIRSYPSIHLQSGQICPYVIVSCKRTGPCKPIYKRVYASRKVFESVCAYFD